MRKLTKIDKAAAGIAAGAIVVATAGAAYAYYRTDVASTVSGTAAISDTDPGSVVASIKSGATGLVPGNGPHNLVVTLTNNNPFAVDVDGETLTLDFANASSTDKPDCTPAAALLSAPAQTGISHIFGKATAAAGDNTDAFDVTFAVSMADSLTVPQDACNGATLTIPVVAS